MGSSGGTGTFFFCDVSLSTSLTSWLSSTLMDHYVSNTEFKDKKMRSRLHFVFHSDHFQNQSWLFPFPDDWDDVFFLWLRFRWVQCVWNLQSVLYQHWRRLHLLLCGGLPVPARQPLMQGQEWWVPEGSTGTGTMIRGPWLCFIKVKETLKEEKHGNGYGGPYHPQSLVRTSPKRWAAVMLQWYADRLWRHPNVCEQP